MRRTLAFLGALLVTNLKASLALRGAFWTRVVFMALNNLIVFVMWIVFFDRYGEIRGWRIEDMAALFGVAAAAFGVAVVVGHGVHDLARIIHTGDLDSYLTQPKSPLLQSVLSRSEASGWGDIATASVMLGLSGFVSPTSIPLCLLAAACGAAVFLATGVLVHCSAFWLGNTSDFARQAWHFLIFFAIYPRTVFTGWVKLLLFTALPAGFISYLPVDMLREFHWSTLLAVVGSAAAYCGLASLVFRLGLRRYESGNRFGVRA